MKPSSPLRILLVEDDEHDRLAFHRSLRRSQMACQIADCPKGDQALDRLCTNSSDYDLVVVDHGLPGMSGLDLCRELLLRGTPVPLVILTGRGSEQLAVQALKAGVDDYLIKDPGERYLDLLPVVLQQVLGKHHDRLARRQAEEALRVSEQKYRFLFDNDPNPLFFVCVNSGRILDVNVQGSSTYQYCREELLSMSFFQFFDHEEATYLRNELIRQERDVLFFPKMWARSKDGRLFCVQLHARAGRFKDINQVHQDRWMIVRTVDMTRHLESEARMAQANKMATLGEMATGLARELNQPLSVIQLGAEFFAKIAQLGGQLPEERVARVVQSIVEQVKRATGIVDNLRDLARPSHVQAYPVDLNESIQDILDMISHRLRASNVQVKLSLRRGLPPILADKSRLEQIFLNLIDNAADALEKKMAGETKQLAVATYQANGKLVAVVSDTGTGMTRAVQERIFQPFFTTKEPGKGIGLGLSIAYYLTKGFGGDIEVKSTPGAGTVVTLTFPCDG